MGIELPQMAMAKTQSEMYSGWFEGDVAKVKDAKKFAAKHLAKSPQLERAELINEVAGQLNLIYSARIGSG